MKINKSHDAWLSAPWYIKVSAWGMKTYSGIQLMAFICFLLSNVAFVTGFVFVYLDNTGSALVAFSLISFAGSAYLYSIVQVWLLKNNEVLQ